MDNSISLQVKRLIEIDRKAVELAEKRELELKDLDENHKSDIDRINNMLQHVKEEVKHSYNSQIQNAQKEAAAMSSELDKKIMKTEQIMSQAVEGLAEELWSKVLNSIK
ncbi:MAG: hypothetical protein WBL93_11880 [Lutisporaceae bacterium]